MNSFRLNLCEGCSHIENNAGEFCYMFRDRPETLPCGQHDKYAEVRKKNGEMLRKNPALFIELVEQFLSDGRVN